MSARLIQEVKERHIVASITYPHPEKDALTVSWKVEFDDDSGAWVLVRFLDACETEVFSDEPGDHSISYISKSRVMVLTEKDWNTLACEGIAKARQLRGGQS